MRRYDLIAAWDGEAKVWWGTNDELPVTTEGRTLEELEARAREIGQEMAELNGLAAPGERVEIQSLTCPANPQPKPV